MSSSAQAGECDALITVALGTPLAAGGRAAAGSPANKWWQNKMMAGAPNRQKNLRGIAHNYVTEILPK